MISLATETDRTLFFDSCHSIWAPCAFQDAPALYTCARQYSTRPAAADLEGSRRVVFVADSQEERMDANLEPWTNLREHLKEHNLNFGTILTSCN